MLNIYSFKHTSRSSVQTLTPEQPQTCAQVATYSPQLPITFDIVFPLFPMIRWCKVVPRSASTPRPPPPATHPPDIHRGSATDADVTANTTAGTAQTDKWNLTREHATTPPTPDTPPISGLASGRPRRDRPLMPDFASWTEAPHRPPPGILATLGQFNSNPFSTTPRPLPLAQATFSAGAWRASNHYQPTSRQ